MTSRGAAGRLSSQAATFYEKGIEKLGPPFVNALIMVETVYQSSSRYGESDKNNIF